MTITAERMDWWFKRNSNVLLRGRHGVGKTAMIQECFERNGLILNESYIYLSASTLDPWVDLIGVPKEQSDSEGNKYLGLVRPELLYKGNIQAIFFDEYNRSPKEVRNAVMELIQKKSINGFKFPNLRMVWAAVNPVTEDNSYAVEDDDKAQIDRFKVQVDVPYECDRGYFVKTYGENLACAALEWWNGLPEAEKDKVSPRRLDYAVEEFVAGGFVEDILPASSNISKLLKALRVGSVELKLKEFYETKDKKAIKAFFASENNCDQSLKYLLNNDDYLKFFLPFLNKEKLVSVISVEDKVLKHIIDNREDEQDYQNILQNVLAGGNLDLIRRIRAAIKPVKRSVSMHEPFNKGGNASPPQIHSPVKTRKDLETTFFDVMKNAHVTDFSIIDKKIDSFENVVKNLPSDITLNEAESVLRFISKICTTSTVATISSVDFYNLIPVTNFAVDTIAKYSKTDPADIFRLSEFSELAKLLKGWGLSCGVIGLNT